MTTPMCHASPAARFTQGSSRNLPSFTVTSTRARSSMPLWLVGAHVEHALAADDLALLLDRVAQRARKLGFPA